MSQNGAGKPFTLAKPWILPFIIVSGLAAAWAAPWSFGDLSYLDISKVIVPLVVIGVEPIVTPLVAEDKPTLVTVPVVALAVSVVGVGVVQATNDADTRIHNNSFFIRNSLEIRYSLFQ